MPQKRNHKSRSCSNRFFFFPFLFSIIQSKIFQTNTCNKYKSIKTQTTDHPCFPIHPPTRPVHSAQPNQLHHQQPTQPRTSTTNDQPKDPPISGLILYQYKPKTEPEHFNFTVRLPYFGHRISSSMSQIPPFRPHPARKSSPTLAFRKPSYRHR